MTLATVDASGLPDARMVLCKQADAEGLVFFTNIESAKGRELAAASKAAALFHWKSLRRQARFRGAVTMLDEAAADAYFRTRVREPDRGVGEPAIAAAGIAHSARGTVRRLFRSVRR